MSENLPHSTARTLIAILAALLTASWSFVGLLYLAYLPIRVHGDIVRGKPFFLPLVVTVVVVSFILAVTLARLVFRRICRTPKNA